MEHFTKEVRQEIIKDFCTRNRSDFDPRAFEEEVRRTGRNHPAYHWFEWSTKTAATEYRIWQARTFARGLRVSFTVENISREGTISIRSVEVPLVISPVAGRSTGGGYYLTDLENPDHMAEFCRQAATDLGRWLRRYEAALLHVDGSVQAIQRQLMLLEANSAPIHTVGSEDHETSDHR